MKYLIYLVYDGGDAGTISLSVLDKDVKLAKKIFNDADDFLVVADKPAENSDIVDFYDWVKKQITIKKDDIKETEKRLVGLSQEVLDREYKRDLISFNNFQNSLKNSGGSGFFDIPIHRSFKDTEYGLKNKIKSLMEELELLSKVK